MIEMLAVTMPLIGSAISTDATVEQGFAIRKEKYFEAQQLDANAGQVVASASFEVGDELRKYEVLQSRALAIAGAGGGSTTDNSVINLIAGIAEEGERNSQRIMFGARDQARVMRASASARRFEGEQAKDAGKRKGMSTLLAGAGRSAINFFGAGKTRKIDSLVGFR